MDYSGMCHSSTRLPNIILTSLLPGLHSCPSLPSESIIHRWESHWTGELSMGIHMYLGLLYTTVTIPCRTGGTVQWNPMYMYHLGPPQPTCPSYPTVPCRTGGTFQWNPMYVPPGPIPKEHSEDLGGGVSHTSHPGGPVGAEFYLHQCLHAALTSSSSVSISWLHGVLRVHLPKKEQQVWRNKLTDGGVGKWVVIHIAVIAILHEPCTNY